MGEKKRDLQSGSVATPKVPINLTRICLFTAYTDLLYLAYILYTRRLPANSNSCVFPIGYLSWPSPHSKSRGLSGHVHVHSIPTFGTGKFKNEPAASPSRRLSLSTLA